VNNLNFAGTGAQNPRRCDAFFGGKAELPLNPESFGFQKGQPLSDDSLCVFSMKTFGPRTAAGVFSRLSGTLGLNPIQRTLQNVRALHVQSLAPGDGHQGAGSLGSIEAKSYATRSFKEYPADGR
jgi:hypothetical protein